MAGWALFFGLTAFAAFDAIGVGVLVSRSRAERFVVAMAVFFLLIAAPSLTLGYLGALTRTNLALGALTLFGATFAALARAMPGRALSKEIIDAARELAMLPIDAVRECVRARSVAVVGVLWASGLAAYELFEAWRVPNVDWDMLIYHQPIVGFALQNRGFAIVSLPPNASMQAINGYPKLCEMTSLWFVAFTDRTLMELPNVLSYPALLAAAFVIFKRFTDRTSAIGFASVLAFMPQVWAQLCLMEIDVEVAFFAVMALHFATRPSIRLRDAWCVWLGAALLVMSKGSGLAIAAAVVVVATIRTRHVLTTACGAVITTAIASVPYVRNWRVFHNPLWPVTIHVPALGIDWKGILTMREIVVDQPLRETFKSYYELPGTGLGDVIRHGFGLAIPWMIFPMAALGLAGVLFELARRRRDAEIENLAWIVSLGVVFTLTTPTLGRNARYNVHILVCVMALAVWLHARVPVRAIRDGVLATALALSVVPLFRMNGWLWSSGAATDQAFLAHPFGSRSHLEHARLELLADARDRELHEGDVAAIDQEVLFLGELWSFDFSSRLEPFTCTVASDCLRDLDAMHAKWVGAGSGTTRAALDRNADWELVGQMTSEDGTMVYRRRRTYNRRAP